jgi:hypothetical protein
MEHLSQDRLQAAIEMAQQIHARADTLSTYPNHYRPSRVKGTQELVVLPNLRHFVPRRRSRRCACGTH